jgi:hypothetical protein
MITVTTATGSATTITRATAVTTVTSATGSVTWLAAVDHEVIASGGGPTDTGRDVLDGVGALDGLRDPDAELVARGAPDGGLPVVNAAPALIDHPHLG